MQVLKCVGYLVAAIAVLAAIVFGGITLLVIGIIIGVLIDVFAALLLTAASLKSYFGGERSDKKTG